MTPSRVESIGATAGAARDDFEALLGLLMGAAFWLLAFPSYSNVGVGLLVVCALVCVVSRPRRPMPHSLALGLGAFAGSLALSTFMSDDVAHSLSHTVAFAPGALTILLIAGFLNPTAMWMLLRVVAAIVVLLGGSLTVAAFHWPHDAALAVLGTTLFVVPNDVCFLAVMLPAAIALGATSRREGDKLIAVLASVFTLSSAVLLESRLGVLSALVSLVLSAATFYRGRRARLVMTAVIAASCLMIVDAVHGRQLIEKALHETWIGRLAAWRIAALMFADAPVIGHGPRTYAVLYDHYFRAMELLPWMDPRSSAWAHNLYLETLAEQGLVGLAALAMLFIDGVRSTSSRPARGRRVDAIRASARAGLSMMAIVAMFEASFVRLWVVLAASIWLGIAAAVVTAGDDEGSET